MKNKKILSSIFAATMGLSAVVAIPVAMTSCGGKEDPTDPADPTNVELKASLTPDSALRTSSPDTSNPESLTFNISTVEESGTVLDPAKVTGISVKLDLKNTTREFSVNGGGGDPTLEIKGIDLMNNGINNGTDSSYGEPVVSLVDEDGSINIVFVQIKGGANAIGNVPATKYNLNADADDKTEFSGVISFAYDGILKEIAIPPVQLALGSSLS